MKILLIHQYFLGKNSGGGARFNEMTKIWAKEGHDITVIAGMLERSKKVDPRYKGKLFYVEKEFEKNTDVYRCHVSELYDVNFLGRLWAIFLSFFQVLGRVYFW